MPLSRRTFGLACIGTASTWLGTRGAHAQGAERYPNKPIRIVVPVAAGGSTDVITRMVAERASPLLGQPIIIDNRPGAGGILGTAFVEDAAPDGYTLLMAYAAFTLSPHLFRTTKSYDPLAFVPVTQMVTQPICIVAHPSFAQQTLPELLAFGKANPGRLQVGIATSGSSGHLAFEQLRLSHGLDAQPIIYKSAAPNMAALLSGEVPVSFSSVSAALPLAKAGKLRILATLTPERLKQTPAVPTAKEGGVNLLAAGWTGLVGPPKMPAATAARLHATFSEVLRQPDMVERLAGVGADVVGNSPAEFAADIEREFQLFKSVVERSNMKPN